MNCMEPAVFHCLFNLLGVIRTYTRQSNLLKPNSCDGGLADWLFSGHQMVQVTFRHANALPLYSLGNGTVSPFWQRGI